MSWCNSGGCCYSWPEIKSKRRGGGWIQWRLDCVLPPSLVEKFTLNICLATVSCSLSSIFRQNAFFFPIITSSRKQPQKTAFQNSECLCPSVLTLSIASAMRWLISFESVSPQCWYLFLCMYVVCSWWSLTCFSDVAFKQRTWPILCGCSSQGDRWSHISKRRFRVF